MIKLDKTWKKVVAFALGFIALVASSFFIGNAIHQATRPDNHNENFYGVVRVRLAGEGWTAERREAATKAMEELERLGPSFLFVADNAPAEITGIPVWIDAQIPEGEVGGRCPAGVYQTFPHDNNSVRITLFPACIHSNLEFQGAFMHELGHAIGMDHICRTAGEDEICSSVGHGVSFMNPNLVYDEALPTTTHFSIPMLEVTELDVREYRMARGRASIRTVQ